MTTDRLATNRAKILPDFALGLQRKLSREFRVVILLTLVHIPFALLLYRSSLLALVHPAAVLLIGLYWAMNKQVKLERIALLCAYIVGSEVLWRMTDSSVFYEFGKYGSALIMLTALLQRGKLKVPRLPLLYFALLIPACLLTIAINDFLDARNKLSFNMSGPLLLLVSCWFFSHIQLNVYQIRRIFFAVIIPLISVASVTLISTVAAENVNFTTESNKVTSGGFGPNQVSSMLGLGVFVAVASLLLFNNSLKHKVYFCVAALFLTAQSVMTFSRGGIYNAIGAGLVLVLLLSGNLWDALKKLVPVGVIVLLFVYIILPVLNGFTGGKLQERFEETGTTNRVEIMESDFEIFAENPILGAGVGEAQRYRMKFLEFEAISHTEFSRLVSEHGSLGIIAIMCLGLTAFFNIMHQPSNMGRALAAGFIVWSSLFMLNAGMRLAAPSLFWGISFVTIRHRRRKPRVLSRGLEEGHGGPQMRRQHNIINARITP